MLTRNTFLQVSLFVYNYRHVLYAAIVITLLILALMMPTMVILAEGGSGPNPCPAGC